MDKKIAKTIAKSLLLVTVINLLALFTKNEIANEANATLDWSLKENITLICLIIYFWFNSKIIFHHQSDSREKSILAYPTETYNQDGSFESYEHTDQVTSYHHHDPLESYDHSRGNSKSYNHTRGYYKSWKNPRPDVTCIKKSKSPILSIISKVFLFFSLFPICWILVRIIVAGIYFFGNYITCELVAKYNFYLSLAIAFCLLLPAIRPSVIKRQSWKKLKDVWLNWWNYKSTAALLFLVQGGPISYFSVLIDKAMQMSQFDIKILSLVFIFSLLSSMLATIFHKNGAAIAVSEESNIPIFYFYPSLTLAILSDLGVVTLIWNGSILTFYAYLS